MAGSSRLFVGCVISLVATSFGFIARALLLNTLGAEFGLSEEQKGALQGAGLFPFAVSIILASLVVDRVGYGRCMVFAWVGHALSGVLMIVAEDFKTLYIGTLLFALANGTVEAVINPVTATLYPRAKTHYLNILHAGWPGGLVLGGLLFLLLGEASWQVKMALYLVPTGVYGVLMLGQRFPVQERVRAGVPFADMLREFGWAGTFIVSYFIVLAVDSVLLSLEVSTRPMSPLLAAAIAVLPAILFAILWRSFGRPLFVLLLLMMVLLATTELGTDGWVAALMEPVFGSRHAGTWVLITTSAIMFVLRFFAGPIVHRISPLGLLAASAALAALGLVGISQAGPSLALVFLAATLYGVGKTFFWPTTLGVVSEQFPRGGAMTLNAIGGIGMISVGVLGGPFLGALQDRSLDGRLRAEAPALRARIAGEERQAYLMRFAPVDRARESELSPEEAATLQALRARNSQDTLRHVAILPFAMLLGYLGLILHFRRRGGYRPVELTEALGPADP
jgi:MFS family permease